MSTDLWRPLAVRLRRVLAAAVLTAVAIAVGGCGDNTDKADQSADVSDDARKQYEARLIVTEDQLAAKELPYLVITPAKRLLQIKLAGTVVRDFHFQFAGDTAAGSFAADWIESGRPARQVGKVHLFEVSKKLNDTVVAVVSRVTKVPEDQIQRYVPQRMLVVLRGGFRIDINSEVEGRPLSSFGNLTQSLRDQFGGLFGAERLEIQVTGDEAMALYGVCQPGTPVLLTP